jgi:hypothetical protein
MFQKTKENQLRRQSITFFWEEGGRLRVTETNLRGTIKVVDKK